MEDLDAWALNLATLGHSGAVLPLLADRTAAEACRLRVPQWEALGLSPTVAQKIVDGLASLDLAEQVKLARRFDIRFMGCHHPDFPARLRDIAHPPLALAVRGVWPLTHGTRAVAMVGTRRPSSYGRSVAQHFATYLARRAWVIVSGMALGIDCASHQGALEGKGSTVAVLGCGVDRCYPAELQSLRDRILTSGCVVSQYALGSRPMPYHFPFRNRLISGLSEAVLVVEASMKSGSLHTVNWAEAQGCEVMAVPGSIYAENSELPNLLLSQGAVPALSPEEVNRHLKGPDLEAVRRSNQPLSLTESTLFQCLDRPRTIDEVCYLTGLPVGTVLSQLLSLEIKGWLQRLPGNRYARAA